MVEQRRSRSELVLPAVVTFVLTGLLLLLVRSTGRAQSASPAPVGRTLYEQACAWCHGAEGQGTPNGPSLIGVGAASADFMLRTGRMPISHPERQPQRGTPAYTSEQIDQLVGFVGSLGSGPAIPTVDPGAGDLGEGASLYQEHCAACHSSTGVGGALTNGLQAPGLQDATPVEVAEAVRLGGAGLRSGNMPQFGTDVISDHELDSVVRYVQYLHHPQDRGGAGLARLGPVAEGFVTWLGALLLIVLLVRWIGKRTPA